jgi:hypothetical protein
MPRREPLGSVNPRVQAVRPSDRPLIWSALAVVPVAIGLLLLLRAPAAVVLPALSTASVAAGLLLASLSYARGFRLEPERVGPYEIAGALLFVGFAAALMTDTEQAFAVFEHLEASGLATASSSN